ncbi:MAG: phosphoribosyltransferase family protein [Candidatus Paceibacterota bacterium]
MRFLNTILEIVFPIKCILCGKTGLDLCLDCLREAPAAERESAKWIFPIYDYRHPSIKKSLWLLKYKGKKRLAVVFAEIVYEKMLEELSELSLMENFSQPILIPIPLSAKRYRERGYNQAELLCREMIKLSTLRHDLSMHLLNNILIKPKETLHQAQIKNRSARLKNIIGSFIVKNENLIKNKNIILIDDILTTGATLSEAKKVLRQAGARKVIAFTVAH